MVISISNGRSSINPFFPDSQMDGSSSRKLVIVVNLGAGLKKPRRKGDERPFGGLVRFLFISTLDAHIIEKVHLCL